MKGVELMVNVFLRMFIDFLDGFGIVVFVIILDVEFEDGIVILG